MNKAILTGAGIIGAGAGIKKQIDASKEFDDAKTTPKSLIANGTTEGLKYIGYAAGATKLIESAITKKAPNLATIGLGAGFGAIEGYLGQKEAQKYNKDIKFIILKYPTEHISPEELNELYTTERWNELSLDGFIVIDLKEYIDEDLTDKKYMFQDFHPNKEAWDVITNKLAKDINNSKI